MKNLLKLTIIVFFLVCLSACPKNEKVKDGILRGMYEGTNQAQEMEEDANRPGLEEAPSYDSYKRERKEMMDSRE